MLASFPLPPIELRFHPRESSFPIDPRDSRSPIAIQIAPGFVSQPENFSYHGEVFTLHTVTFYYSTNLALGCCGEISPTSKMWGYHRHDFERIGFLLDAHGTVRHVYFFAHGRGQGCWRAWDACEKTAEGSLVAYVAYRSHAAYPDPRYHLRIFGLANDACSNNGRRARVVFLSAFNFMPFSSAGPGRSMTTRPVSPATDSMTPLRRFFFPLSKWIREKRDAGAYISKPPVAPAT